MDGVFSALLALADPNPDLALDAQALSSRAPTLVSTELVNAVAFQPCDRAQVRALVMTSQTRLEAGDRLYCFAVAEPDASQIDREIEAFSEFHNMQSRFETRSERAYSSHRLSLAVSTLTEEGDAGAPVQALYFLILREGEL